MFVLSVARLFVLCVCRSPYLLSYGRGLPLELVAQFVRVEVVPLEQLPIGVEVHLVGKLVVRSLGSFGTATAADLLDNHGLRYLYHFAFLSFPKHPECSQAIRTIREAKFRGSLP